MVTTEVAFSELRRQVKVIVNGSATDFAGRPEVGVDDYYDELVDSGYDGIAVKTAICEMAARGHAEIVGGSIIRMVNAPIGEV